DLPGAFIYVRSAEVTGDPRANDEWKLPFYDGQVCGADGAFKTEMLVPGTYTVVAQAYGKDPYPHLSGLRLPDLLGTAKVTVPERGEAGAVVVELKPRAEPTTPATRP